MESIATILILVLLSAVLIVQFDHERTDVDLLLDRPEARDDGRRLEWLLALEHGQQAIRRCSTVRFSQGAAPRQHGAAQDALFVDQAHVGKGGKVGRLHDRPWS